MSTSFTLVRQGKAYICMLDFQYCIKGGVLDEAKISIFTLQ